MLVRLLSHPAGAWIAVGATCVATFFLNLGRPWLWDPDEGRYAEIAREMLASGNWLTPTLNFQPFGEKPMLFFWLAGASMGAFGATEWALRLPSAVAATLTVFATVWWGRRFIDPLAGTLAGLILATAGMFVALGRYVLLDMLFSLWISCAFFYGGVWWLRPVEARPPVWPFYAFLALGTLTKGPVIVVLAAVVFAPLLWRSGIAIRELRLAHGLLILLAIAGSWYGAAALAAPEYMGEFVWGHNVGRFTSRATGHPMPRFAYLYILPAAFLPWSVLLPAAVLHARASPDRAWSPAIELCTVWLAGVVILFSLSAAKLATYMLPALPPLALLFAMYAAAVLRRAPLPGVEATALRGACAALALLVVAAPAAAAMYLAWFAPDRIVTAIVAVSGWPFVLLGWRALRAGRADHVLASIFALMLTVVVVLYQWLIPAVNDVHSLRSAASHVARLPPGTRVLSSKAKTSSLAFYAGQPLEPIKYLDQAGAVLSDGGPAALVTKRRLADNLRCHLRAPAYVWWQNHRTKMLVANRPPPDTPAEMLIVLNPEARADCPR